MTEGPPLSRYTYDRAAVHRTDDAWLADAWPRVPGRRGHAEVGRADRRRRHGWSSATRTSIAADAPRRFLGVIDDVAVLRRDGRGRRRRRVADAARVRRSRRRPRSGAGRQRNRPRAVASTAHALPAVRRADGRDRRPAGREPAPPTSSQHFPRTDPAVIMLIHDGGDRALLGRGPQWGEGRFSTLAGFVEPGESLEAAVAREVYEEVGVAITDIRYLASQPWPFPASLMVGFIARLDGDPSHQSGSGRDGRRRLVHSRRDPAGARLDR